LHKLALLGLIAALQIGATDPRVGSWMLTSAQSTLDPPNKLSITSLHGEVHVAISGEKHLDFTAKLGGHGSAVQGNPAFNQIELRRIDRHQVEVIQKKDGTVVATIPDSSRKERAELLGQEIEELVVEAKRLGLSTEEVIGALRGHWERLTKAANREQGAGERTGRASQQVSKSAS